MQAETQAAAGPKFVGSSNAICPADIADATSLRVNHLCLEETQPDLGGSFQPKRSGGRGSALEIPRARSPIPSDGV